MLNKKFLTCEKDNHGWCDVTVGQFSGRASYVTDVPFDCINAAIFSLTNNTPFAVQFDAEGSDFIVVVDAINAFVISDDDGLTFYKCDDIIGKDDIALQIYKDISENFDSWVNFLIVDEEEKNVSADKLKAKLNELKYLLTDFCIIEDESD